MRPPERKPASFLPAVRLVTVWVFILLWLPSALAGPTANPKTKPATIKITGFGWFGDREIKRTLRTLELGRKKPEFFEADFIEDAALIIASRVKRDGYLAPKLDIDLTTEAGAHLSVDANTLVDKPLPRPLHAIAVEFHIHKGVLYYYQHIGFTGLQSVTEKEALSYFVETGTLLNLKHTRVFTPEKLRHGLASLGAVLDRKGHRDAKVEATDVQTNRLSGTVLLRVRVEEGPKYTVHQVQEKFYSGSGELESERTRLVDKPYSQTWLEDFQLGLRTNAYARGFPDVAVQVKTIAQRDVSTGIALDLQASVTNGPQVRIRNVQFEGEKKTSLALMARRVRVKRGELLDPNRTERGRYRLAQLGVFDRVDLSYKSEDENTRDVIYSVKEGKTQELSLLFGWGSYELLRGGFEADQENIWGLAHHATLKAVQSFKASSGEFNYTVPDFTSQDLDLFANGIGLRRQEISFLREEYGGGLGIHRFFKSLSTDLTVRYNYQILNALNTIPAVASEGVTNPAVGSIISDIRFDRRDNPLYPRKGYKIFATVETAADQMGGDVNFERIEAFSSWHHPLGGGRWLSLGLSHGAAVSFGAPENNLPFNKRFFPGGENSIRGYTEGEASPRNAAGQLVGAETYMLASVELEQALTPKWSVVVFSDSLGMAHRLAQYPFDTGLYSVGVGLRWRTLIGPVRLEYGHNLDPRPRDPSGTLQFSLGFPF